MPMAAQKLWPLGSAGIELLLSSDGPSAFCLQRDSDSANSGGALRKRA